MIHPNDKLPLVATTGTSEVTDTDNIAAVHNASIFGKISTRTHYFVLIFGLSMSRPWDAWPVCSAPCLLGHNATSCALLLVWGCANCVNLGPVVTADFCRLGGGTADTEMCMSTVSFSIVPFFFLDVIALVCWLVEGGRRNKSSAPKASIEQMFRVCRSDSF